MRGERNEEEENIHYMHMSMGRVNPLGQTVPKQETTYTYTQNDFYRRMPTSSSVCTPGVCTQQAINISFRSL